MKLFAMLGVFTATLAAVSAAPEPAIINVPNLERSEEGKHDLDPKIGRI